METCSKIRCVVRLRQTLRRWRRRAASRPPADVPAGHVAVCVGSGSRRFVVRAALLGHPVFRRLLAQAEEEFGFSARAGPLSLPSCNESLFEELLRHVSSPAKLALLDDLKSCCCCHVSRHAESPPLLGSLAEKLFRS